MILETVRDQNAAYPELDTFALEVVKYHHLPVDVARIRYFFEKVTDQKQKLLALHILATSPNIACMQYAIELDPSLGTLCAEGLIRSTRERHDKVPSATSAQQLRQAFLLAYAWLEKAGNTSPQLLKEIESGLESTDWVHS